jgi:hypothetical protein
MLQVESVHMQNSDNMSKNDTCNLQLAQITFWNHKIGVQIH